MKKATISRTPADIAQALEDAEGGLECRLAPSSKTSQIQTGIDRHTP